MEPTNGQSATEMRAAALQLTIDKANEELERTFLGGESALDRLRSVAAILDPRGTDLDQVVAEPTTLYCLEPGCPEHGLLGGDDTPGILAEAKATAIYKAGPAGKYSRAVDRLEQLYTAHQHLLQELERITGSAGINPARKVYLCRGLYLQAISNGPVQL